MFRVERHIRGKWVCSACETLIQTPVPAQIIDKGIPTAGLLAQVLIAKFCDHLPLYRKPPGKSSWRIRLVLGASCPLNERWTREHYDSRRLAVWTSQTAAI